MRKTLPGTKQPRIPRLWHLSEYLPDARYASLPDVAARWRYSSASLQSTHTTLAVNDEVNGRDIFDDAERPVSGGAEKEATAIYEFPPGTPVVTVIEATSGVPTGEAHTIISTELFTLLPQIPTVVLRGKDRLRVSRRREAERANTGVDISLRTPHREEETKPVRQGLASSRRIALQEYRLKLKEAASGPR